MLYTIHGAVLRQLMIDSFKMEVLSFYSAEEYKTGERHHLAIAMLELPWNGGRSYEDMLRVIDEEGYDTDEDIQGYLYPKRFFVEVNDD